jgi:FkbM family methyltransferase
MNPKSLLLEFLRDNESFSKKILTAIRKTGFDVINGPNPDIAILEKKGINVLLDVGANIGQFGRQMRILGYENKIVSFEPLAEVFPHLNQRANRDGNWVAENFALGSETAKTTINVFEETVFSSILAPTPQSIETSHSLNSYSQQSIQVKKLDDIFHQYVSSGDRVFLKIDVQGYEKNVLQGAENILNQVLGVRLELSFLPQYEQEVLMTDMLELMSSLGFTLVSLKPLSHNLESGEIIQADGIFLRI